MSSSAGIYVVYSATSSFAVYTRVGAMRSLWLVAFIFAWLGLACEHPTAPPLIAADELAPREAEVGDRLEVKGSGFPKGRTARMTFRGTLHRPGEPPTRVDVEA